MPKAELLDPQGKAVAGALARIGKGQFTGVRLGKRFELTVNGPIDDATKAAVEEIAADILSNSVIEDVVGIHYPQADA
jgi:phosphoribosylformylglycinamidine synthase